MALKIQDLLDKAQVEEFVKNWELVSGFQAIVVGRDERVLYVPTGVNAQSFIEANEGNAVELVVNKEKIGTIYVGKRSNSWESELMNAARSAGAESYSFEDSLRVSEIASEERFAAAKNFLGESLTGLLSGTYTSKNYEAFVGRLASGIEETQSLVKEIRKSTNDLKNIQSRQKILALNANIEAARAGEHGKGFGVVADEVGRLSDNSNAVNEKITSVVKRISEVVGGLSIDGNK